MRPSDWAGPYDADTWIHRLDPRARMVGALLLAITALAITHAHTLVTMLACSLLVTGTAGFTTRQLVYRLSALLAFVMLLVLFMPLSVESFHAFSISYSSAVLRDAWLISAKACFIMLIMMSFIGTIEPVSLGHAMTHLHVPAKLVQMYLFTVRYFDILRREMQVMHTAMLARSFRPTFSRHAVSHYGQLIGMLIIRSLDRSERILCAMKCRGYHGMFYLYHHFHFTRRDVAFVLAITMMSAGLVYWEYIL